MVWSEYSILELLSVIQEYEGLQRLALLAEYGACFAIMKKLGYRWIQSIGIGIFIMAIGLTIVLG